MPLCGRSMSLTLEILRGAQNHRVAAAGNPWPVRLKALVPLWMPWVRKRIRPSSEVERQLERISARQIARRLPERKPQDINLALGRLRSGLVVSAPSRQ